MSYEIDNKSVGTSPVQSTQSVYKPFNLYQVKRLASQPLKMGTDMGILDKDLPASGNVRDIVDWSKARSVSKMDVDPSSSFSGLSALSGLVEDPIDKAKRLKHQRQVQNVLAVGDAIRHLGNIFNTVNGAPVQQFNSPLVDYQKELSKDDALRASYRKQLLSYQQAKDALDYKNRVMGMRQKAADDANEWRQKNYDLALRKANEAAGNKDWDHDMAERKLKFQKEQANVKNNLARMRINKSGGGSMKHGVPIYNPETGKYEMAFTQWEYKALAGKFGYDTNSESRSVTNVEGTKRNTTRTNAEGSIGRQSAAAAKRGKPNNAVRNVLSKGRQKSKFE